MVNLEFLIDFLSCSYPNLKFNDIDETSYIADYGLDSISIVLILMSIEKKTGKKVDIEKLQSQSLLKFSDLLNMFQ